MKNGSDNGVGHLLYEREIGPHRIQMDIDMFEAAREGDLHRLAALLSPTTKPATLPADQIDIVVLPSVDATGTTAEVDCIFAVTAGGNTVLHIAASQGKMGFVEEVCRLEPSVIAAANARLDTALHSCARAGHQEVISILIDAARKDVGVGDLQGILRARNLSGDTALHEAARGGHVGVAEKLIAADIGLLSMVNDAAMSALYLAVMQDAHDMIRAFLRASCSPAAVAHAGPGRRTALHCAVLRSEETTRRLLKWKPSLAKEADDSESTPLHYVASAGATAVACILLKHDASTAYIPDEDGSFPIHVAATMCRLGVIHAILEHCPDSLELVDAQGRNFLHVAVLKQRLDVVEYVIERPDLEKLLNDRDFAGNTPLHLAVAKSFKTTVYALLKDKRVESSIMNNEGCTPLDLAERLDPGIRYRLNPQACIIRCLADTGAMFSPNRSDRVKRNWSLDLERETKKHMSLSKNLAIASVLIATVTFAAGFTVPGGYKSEDHPGQGKAILANKYPFKVFLISNTFAMVCSLIATCRLIFAGALMVDIRIRVRHLIWSMTFLWIAFACMAVAFGMAAFAVVVPQAWGVGVLVCVIAFGTPLVTACLTTVPVISFLFTATGRLGIRQGIMKTKLHPQTKKRLGKNFRISVWSMIMVILRVLLIYAVIFFLALL